MYVFERDIQKGKSRRVESKSKKGKQEKGGAWPVGLKSIETNKQEQGG